MTDLQKQLGRFADSCAPLLSFGDSSAAFSWFFFEIIVAEVFARNLYFK